MTLIAVFRLKVRGKRYDKSIMTTFNAGDSILFHAGQEWEGILHPGGSGEDGHPIVISRYGHGEMP